MLYKVVLLLFLLLSPLIAKEKRVALIIGNNNYAHVEKLSNAINDTFLIKEKLQTLNFDVIYLNDATLQETNKALKQFQSKLSKESVGLFYFAGHGVEIDGKNFLLSIDTKVENLKEIKYNSLEADAITRLFKDLKNDMNIVILDACRENPIPFVKSTGLATFTNPEGLFIAYSAQAGTLALDGKKGSNSPFALSFIKNLEIQDLDIEALFKKVRADVYTQTNGKQRPSTYSEIITPFYFNSSTDQIHRALKTKPRVQEHSYIAQDFKRHTRFIEPQMVLIKADTYTKGYNEDFDAAPSHDVKIKKDFYIATHELSFEEFDYFVTDTNWYKPNDNGWGRGKQPVIDVNYEDAMRYVEWLSKKTKKKYRLPTETEWEYVARSGTTKLYGTTDDEAKLQTFAWFEDSIHKQHPYTVGGKRPNSFGVYDMLGNVAEWTSDSFYTYNDVSYKMKKNDADEKVVRGGNWQSTYTELYVYQRTATFFRERNNATGFRLVMESTNSDALKK